MKIKYYLLLILFLSQYSNQGFAAVDIKKKEKIEQKSEINHFQKSNKSISSWFQKRRKGSKLKKRKFRVRDFFNKKKTLIKKKKSR